MSSKTLVIALVIIVLVAIGSYFVFARTSAAPSTAPVSANAEAAAIAQPATPASTTTAPAPVASANAMTVTYTDTGFAPNTMSIKVGDSVHFVNSSSHGMWVASNVHPTHTQYDGTSLSQHCSAGADTNGGFDECTVVKSGTTYSFTFAKAGTFSYHNHVRASDTGTVVVSK
jgi:plastocyanin